MKREIMEAYVGVVLNRFNITEEEFFKKYRVRRITNARYLFYYLCRDRDISIVEIQNFMEDNDHSVTHSTIIYGERLMSKRVEEDKDYKYIVQNIKQQIKIN